MRAFVRSHAAKVTPRSPATRASLALVASAALAGAALPAFGLFAGTALAAPICTTTSGTVSCVFSYSGAAQSWPVPAGITTVRVTADGATGGPSGASSSPGAGGAGGEVKATLSSIPGGTTLSVFPGGAGTAGGLGGINQRPLTVPVPAGRGGNAGAGKGTGADGGSGGGASTVSAGTTGQPFGNILVAAGGGGGGAGTLDGGNAGTSGHPTGDSGEGTGLADGGGGGTLVSGGAGGGGNGLGCLLASGADGLILHGGDGADGIAVICPSGGGGGGSGYYGGGGGGGNYGSGGGGSSYPGRTQTVNGITVTPDTHDHTHWTGGAGQVTISYSLLRTRTSVNCTPNPSAPSQPVTCIATVIPAGVGGAVNFEANGTTIGTCGAVPVSSIGVASCTTSSLPNGDNTIDAIFTPASPMSYAGSTGTTTQVVNALPTRMRSWLVVHANGTYTVLAQLTAGGSGLAGETVTFKGGRNGAALCTAVTSGDGVASCRLTGAETRTLLRYDGAFTASFAGAGQYDASSSYYPGIFWF